MKCGGSMSLRDKVAIITGCGRGFGKAIAQRFAEEEAVISICDIIPANELERRVGSKIRSVGVKVLCSQTDVSQEDQVRGLVARTIEKFGTINILVNNVGISGPTADCQNITVNEWDSTMATNLRSIFLCCKAILPEMIQNKWGRIINMSSITGKNPLPQRTPYATSKMGIIGFTRSLAAEVGPYNITVNTICPSGPQNSERIIELIKARAAYEGKPEKWVDILENRKQRLTRIPLRRNIDHDDVATLTVFLASEQAKNITGEDINVSAGIVMW
jgi:NAD(P)-dependent dehydrogenase (short-subunit alcohol dehydrogenase family)